MILSKLFFFLTAGIQLSETSLLLLSTRLSLLLFQVDPGLCLLPIEVLSLDADVELVFKVFAHHIGVEIEVVVFVQAQFSVVVPLDLPEDCNVERV